MAESERNAASAANPRAEWFRTNVEAVQADLLAVVRTHMTSAGFQVVAHALIETCGSVLWAIVEAEPAVGPDIDAKLGELALFVATTQQPPQ